MLKPYKGQRVVAKCAIDRYPRFSVPALSLGTVSVSQLPDTVCVKMDKPVEGCEPWDNCVHCSSLADFYYSFEDVLVCQLEAALTIIYEGDNADEHHEWLKNTCAALKEAGSVHWVIAKFLKA